MEGLVGMLNPENVEELEELGDALTEMGAAVRKAAGVFRRVRDKPARASSAFIEEEDEQE